MKKLYSRNIIAVSAMLKTTWSSEGVDLNNIQVNESKRRTVMKNFVLHKALFVAYLCLLLIVPVTCLAFGGKVSYPNGAPAVDARVSLIIDDSSKTATLSNGIPTAPPQAAMAPDVSSRPANIPNMNRMVSPLGNQIPKSKSTSTIKCGPDGRFSFPDQVFSNAMIQIKAPDGLDFATTNLPAMLFAKGDLTIVLQPHK